MLQTVRSTSSSSSPSYKSSGGKGSSLRSIPQAHKIVGVFIVGEGANELIQLGSILVNSEATIEQVSRTPFAAVTLCGLFQMACDDALTKIRNSKVEPSNVSIVA